MWFQKGLSLLTFAFLSYPALIIGGELTENLRINSKYLDYELQYRVYIPPAYESLENLPVLYIVDGQDYIQNGRLPEITNRLINRGSINPVIIVFIDARDPNNLKANRRGYEFRCNSRYLNFLTKELLPLIDKSYKTSGRSKGRVILGKSLGGLNSACVGIYAADFFHGIAIQSPAFQSVPKLLEIYKTTETMPIKIYLSSGTINDNLRETLKFRRILKDQNYNLKYREIDKGHDWTNWRSQLPEILRYYFKVD